jgi:predicted metalloendopeptidase
LRGKRSASPISPRLIFRTRSSRPASISFGSVGKLYTDRYFPAATKAKVTGLIGHLKTAFHHRIEKID